MTKTRLDGTGLGIVWSKIKSALSTEATARQTADNTLQANIDTATTATEIQVTTENEIEIQVEVETSAEPVFETLKDGYQSHTADFTSTREYVYLWSGGSSLELNTTNQQKGDMITIRTTSTTLTSDISMYTGTYLNVSVGVLGSTTLFYDGSNWQIYR